MKKAIDKTLDSISDLQDTIDYINTEKIISNEQKTKDLDEINDYLKQAQCYCKVSCGISEIQEGFVNPSNV